MTEESNSTLRITRLESDVKALQSESKDNNKGLVNVEKGDIKSDSFIERIFGMLTDLKLDNVENKKILEENLRKSTITENLAISLKTVTDDLTKGLEAVKLKITEIEQLPRKNNEKLKWVFITFIASNIVGLIGLIWKATANK